MTVRGRFIEHLSWSELEKILPEYRVLMIPVGARLKEHGHHLPLNNDWVMAEYLAKRITELCPVLTIPTVPYGYYPAFLEYPGSVNIACDTFRDMIADLCRSFGRHGLKKFYVLNTGISTNASLKPAKEILASEGLRMEYSDFHVVGAKASTEIMTQEVGTHADEIETSMMLYMAPEIVRMERAQKDIHPDKGPGGLTRNPDAQGGVYSPTGAWGDPTLATLAKGRHVVEALVRDIAGEIEALLSALEV